MNGIEKKTTQYAITISVFVCVITTDIVVDVVIVSKMNAAKDTCSEQSNPNRGVLVYMCLFCSILSFFCAAHAHDLLNCIASNAIHKRIRSPFLLSLFSTSVHMHSHKHTHKHTERANSFTLWNFSAAQWDLFVQCDVNVCGMPQSIDRNYFAAVVS